MHFYDIVRQATLFTGQGGPITLDTAVVGFKTFVQAGVVEGSIVHYSIENPGVSVTDRETCWGVYHFNSGAPSVTRNTISSTAASPTNAPIVLVAGAQITITPYSEDLETLIYDTYAAVQAAVISTGVSVIETRGRVSVGDNGGGRYYRVGSQPSHTGKVQSLDGAWFELGADQWITPEQFGAVGDALVTSPAPTDNTTILKNLATYIMAKAPVGARVRGKPSAVYGVWPGTPADQDVIMDLRGSTLKDFVFDFNGSQIKSLGSWTSSTGGYFIYFRNSTGIELRRPNFYDVQKGGTDFVPGGNEFTYGPSWITTETTSNTDMEGVTIIDLYIVGGRLGFDSSRGVGVSGRVRNIKILGAYMQRVFYPLNFRKNGDEFFGRGISLTGCGRDYFFYNCLHHDVDIRSDAIPVIIPTLDIGLNTDHTEGNDRNTTADIKVRYRLENRSGVMNVGTLAGFSLQQGTATTAVGIMRDIDVHLDVVLAGSVTSSGNMLQTSKTNFAGSADNTGRGYLFDNIRISGFYNANSKPYRALSFFNDSNWTGEFIRNVRIESFIADGVSGVTALDIDGAGADENSPIILRDVQLSGGDLNLTNAKGKFALYNIQAPNYNTSGTVAMTWTQGSGTAPAIVDGSITCHYSREGRKVTVSADIAFAGGTTFGNSGTFYQFNLPTPYDSNPSGNISYFGIAEVINAGTYKTGLAQIQSGTGYFVLSRDGNAAFFRLGNPGTWASGDKIKFTTTYDV